jgi:hypothetical protein
MMMDDDDRGGEEMRQEAEINSETHTHTHTIVHTSPSPLLFSLCIYAYINIDRQINKACVVWVWCLWDVEGVGPCFQKQKRRGSGGKMTKFRQEKAA